MDSVARCQVVVWHTEEGKKKKEEAVERRGKMWDDFTGILLQPSLWLQPYFSLHWKKMVEKMEMNGIKDIFQDVLVLFEEVPS